ncbi:uncharacterized protein LOC131854212 [Achroia grisella]|uniref:uncharacterized protein LOC131854212 n=1 Tax=Achroia grisella TaxID=688607 RepID=UPI0027D25313|nr:uncharacterized protein LOC131854212 [Achroia grisella]
MLDKIVLFGCVGLILSYPNYFETKKFRVGIEYDKSLPMDGGADRYRHRNNYDPFFVTVTTEARNGFVITFLDVTATIDAPGEVTFNMVKGQTGSKTMVFQLVSNHTDFLSYHYLAYGMREADYKKLANIITLPFTNDAQKLLQNYTTTFLNRKILTLRPNLYVQSLLKAVFDEVLAPKLS